MDNNKLKVNKVNMPLVSVVMPVKNGERFVAAAVESILNQTYKNYELLIVDDGSSDGTVEILNKYAKKYPGKVKVFYGKKSRGAFGAVNWILNKSRGKYLAPMDSDDVAYKDRLAKQAAFMEANKDVVVVGSQVEIIDGEGIVVGEKNLPTEHEQIYQDFARVHPMVHPAVMIRRSMLPTKNRLYHDRFGVNDDYFTLMTLLSSGRFANLPEVLLQYRVHGNNSSLKSLRFVARNTVAIRWAAIREYGYEMSLAGWGYWLAQAVAGWLAPEWILRWVYEGFRVSKNSYGSRPVKVFVAWARR